MAAMACYGDCAGELLNLQHTITALVCSKPTHSPCPQAPTGNASLNPLETQSSLTGRTDAPGTEPEDCLFLNVYLSGNTIPTKPLRTPLFIYIIGGADEFSGSDLLHEANNEIVAVIIQYRLNLFGFLPGSEFKANGSLNVGLLDQDFALRWLLYSEVVTQTKFVSASIFGRIYERKTLLETMNTNMNVDVYLGFDGILITQRPLKQGEFNGKALLSVINVTYIA
ncbi:hypothetical protein BT96DRAFT_985748 [Gymnopus androsaceus JB14]|uniref:Carboxylesterase type B domain-containing protein n=1 Tax=Gymnopus androsaceus JB14 TaxID=1447944 RepID=A0A6A4IH59_9AGAR|nr:hypothetical protein BT96DRAFT_985748 [Gymnopus androsaceus JB14]